jgi:uncharacterized Ntn-hydrolase superfamily protein
MPDSDALHKQMTKQAAALTAVAQLMSTHVSAGDYDAAMDSAWSIAEDHVPAFEKLFRQWETDLAEALERSRRRDAKK